MAKNCNVFALVFTGPDDAGGDDRVPDPADPKEEQKSRHSDTSSGKVSTICHKYDNSALFWRKVILVPKVILRYGGLKVFFSLDPKKRPQGRLVGGPT